MIQLFLRGLADLAIVATTAAISRVVASPSATVSCAAEKTNQSGPLSVARLTQLPHASVSHKDAFSSCRCCNIHINSLMNILKYLTKRIWL